MTRWFSSVGQRPSMSLSRLRVLESPRMRRTTGEIVFWGRKVGGISSDCSSWQGPRPGCSLPIPHCTKTPNPPHCDGFGSNERCRSSR